MNERIRLLAEQAENYAAEQSDKFGVSYKKEYNKKFAELIVRECMQLCQQEWYDLNNASDSDIEPRQVAIRVGQKSATIKCMNMIARHFGVKE